MARVHSGGPWGQRSPPAAHTASCETLGVFTRRVSSVRRRPREAIDNWPPVGATGGGIFTRGLCLQIRDMLILTSLRGAAGWLLYLLFVYSLLANVAHWPGRGEVERHLGQTGGRRSCFQHCIKTTDIDLELLFHFLLYFLN